MVEILIKKVRGEKKEGAYGEPEREIPIENRFLHFGHFEVPIILFG